MRKVNRRELLQATVVMAFSGTTLAKQPDEVVPNSTEDSNEPHHEDISITNNGTEVHDIHVSVRQNNRDEEIFSRVYTLSGLNDSTNNDKNPVRTGDALPITDPGSYILTAHTSTSSGSKLEFKLPEEGIPKYMVLDVNVEPTGEINLAGSMR